MPARRIALVNPPHSLEERYGSFRTVGNTMPSLGLLSLAAVLRDQGFLVSVTDAPSRRLSPRYALREILDFAPDAIGMTAFTSSVCNAASLARDLKLARPDLPIALGGPHVSAAPRETLERFPVFDAGATGEGEGSGARLFRALAERANPGAIPGLFVRGSGGAELTETPGPGIAADLDGLPFPAWDLAPGFPRAYTPAAHSYRRLPAATLVTTRGCPERCSFCDRSVFGNRVRALSSRYVLDQMQHLVDRFGVRDLTIYDDIFPLFKQRALEICEGILERGLDLTWSCNSRVNQADPALLKALRRAGCWQIGYGIESGDQGILDRLAKRMTLAEIEHAVRITDEAGIRVKGFFMLGHPGETPQTIRRTIDFAGKLRLTDYQTCFFTPFPGTAIHARVKEFGRFEEDWPRMTLLNPVFVPEGFTPESMRRWAARSYRAFYLRPRIVFRHLKDVRDPGHLMQITRGARVILRDMLLPLFHRPAAVPRARARAGQNRPDSGRG